MKLRTVGSNCRLHLSVALDKISDKRVNAGNTEPIGGRQTVGL